MKKKRFVKLLMGLGYSRNKAETVANFIPVCTIELFGHSIPLTYARTWNAFRAHERVKELAAKEAGSAEA